MAAELPLVPDARVVTQRPVVRETSERKPMARAQSVSLFERTVNERLSAAGIELVLRGAATLSEGGVADGMYQGSTVVSFDVQHGPTPLSDPRDAVTARRVAELCGSDARLRKALVSIALAEAHRTHPAPLQNPALDVRARSQGTMVFLHVDVEAETTRSVP